MLHRRDAIHGVEQLAPILTPVCLSLGLALATKFPIQAAPAEVAEIKRLVQQLGSNKFSEREAAGKRLEAIGEPALDALRKAATTSDDPETRTRARQLIQAIQGGGGKDSMVRLWRLPK